MQITRMKVNHITNPLGFDYSDTGVTFSYVAAETTGKTADAARIEIAADEAFTTLVFDSGKSAEVNGIAYMLPVSVALAPRTRYFWRVTVWADNGDVATSDAAWFETAKMDEPWQAEWVKAEFDQRTHPVLLKDFATGKEIASARAYVSGLGLYEMYINGKRVGDEYLCPGYNGYDSWIQYQTYDLAGLLSGENHMEVMLGDGWYKGRFGFDNVKNRDNLFGDSFAFLCEMHIAYADGTTEVVCSDTSWQARKSKVQESSIYDGEVYDATFADGTLYPVVPADIGFTRVKARLGLPVRVMERIQPIAVLHTPKGETVLDMGQNMVGWLEMRVNAPKGTRIFLQHGEIMQQDCFFNLNLRSAKAEYTYIADGSPAVVRPFFTFYGFRYVKIEGWHGEVKLDDFTGCVVYSDMEQTGSIETNDPLVNKLFVNAMWGQKGNFLDVPTDCPQRDERMGWTGDAQVFCGTASFNMDTYAFFNKYLFDMYREQQKQNGCVPFVVPDMIMDKDFGTGSCAWGDAATVIPWNTYLFYGDKAVLEQQFPSMKAWVDYIRRVDEANGKRNLWLTGFHFGDWLALDAPMPGGCEGGTDKYFIASAYFAYSTELVVKAARVLGKKDEEAEYTALLADIRQAIRDEFFTKTGRLAVPTQTGMVLSLFMNLVPDEHRARLIDMLRAKLEQDNLHLKTGFVGTAYLTRTLSDNGMNDLAYTLLMNQDYPSWLYEVVMGATTVWERWNSLLPDGTISDLTMNSFNHYAYGAVIEWVYRNVCGLQPREDAPGFKRITLAPQPDARLGKVKTQFDSPVGRYESAWAIEADGTWSFNFTVPFDASADLVLPSVSDPAVVTCSEAVVFTPVDGTLRAVLSGGTYAFSYEPAL